MRLVNNVFKQSGLSPASNASDDFATSTQCWWALLLDRERVNSRCIERVHLNDDEGNRLEAEGLAALNEFALLLAE